MKGKNYFVALLSLVVGVGMGRMLFGNHPLQRRQQTQTSDIPTVVRLESPTTNHPPGSRTWLRESHDLSVYQYRPKEPKDQPVVTLRRDAILEGKTWQLTLDGPGYRHPVVLVLGVPETP